MILIKLEYLESGEIVASLVEEDLSLLSSLQIKSMAFDSTSAKLIVEDANRTVHIFRHEDAIFTPENTLLLDEGEVLGRAQSGVIYLEKALGGARTRIRRYLIDERQIRDIELFREG